MPDWNRILIGDAFTRRPLNYYRDLFLLWPFLGFSIAATSYLIEPKFSNDRLIAAKCAAYAVIVLFLAKEKRYLLVGASAYVFIRTAVACIFIHTREAFLWAFVSGLALFLLLRSRYVKEWKPSYMFSRKFYILDLAIGMAGMGAMMLAFKFIKP